MAFNDLRLQVILQALDKATAPLRRIKGASGDAARALKDARDKLKVLNEQQKAVGQFRELQSGLKSSAEKLGAVRARLQELRAAHTADAAAAKAHAAELKVGERIASQLTAAHAKQLEQLGPLRQRLAALGIKNVATDEARLKAEMISTNGIIDQQKAKLKRLGDEHKRMADLKARHAKAMMHTGMIAGAGYGMSAAGRKAGRGVIGALQTGYEFDAQMSATQAVVRIDDKNDPRLKQLRDQARTLPLTTKFTDTEVAQGQYFLARTGYNAEQVHAAMPGMLNMAAAAGPAMDLGQAADIASNIQTAMGIPAEKMDKVADVLTAAFTRNNVDIVMLGESLKYSAGVAREYGQSLETNTAATAVLGNAGVQGSMAGTAMRSVLTRLGNSKTVAQLGVKTQDKDGNMRDMIDILKDINDKTKGMGNVERGAVFKDIAGQYAVTSFGTLMRSVETGDLQKMRASLQGSQGEAAKVASLQLDNLKGDMTMLHAALENISVELFDKNPWLREFVQELTRLMHGFGEFLKAHPMIAQGLVIVGAAFALVLSVLGGLSIALASVLAPMFILRLLFAKMGLSFGPLATGLKMISGVLLTVGRALLMTPIGLAITALAVAAYMLYSNWDGIKGGLLAIWEDLGGSFTAALGTIGAAIINWSPLGLFQMALAGVLSWFGIELPSKFTDFGAQCIQGLIDGFASMRGDVRDAITDIGGSALAWFKEKLGIRSPSRVFIMAGREISNGAAEGITERQHLVRRAALGMATAAAAALPMVAGAGTDGGAPLIDRRPPLSASAAQRSVSIGGDTIHITIQAAPGMDAQALARAVGNELDRRQRSKRASMMSSLSDID